MLKYLLLDVWSRSRVGGLIVDKCQNHVNFHITYSTYYASNLYKPLNLL